MGKCEIGLPNDHSIMAVDNRNVVSWTRREQNCYGYARGLSSGGVVGVLEIQPFV